MNCLVVRDQIINVNCLVISNMKNFKREESDVIPTHSINPRENTSRLACVYNTEKAIAK